MAKTIIQTIGPLYGEVVNGTVFGRPNGSIYVPSVNTVTISIPTGFEYIKLYTTAYGNRFVLCNSGGALYTGSEFKIVAESQDVQSYLGMCVTDSDEVLLGTERTQTAGQFNIVNPPYLGNAGEDTITAGDSYLFIATLYSASGVPIATAKVTLTGVED